MIKKIRLTQGDYHRNRFQLLSFFLQAAITKYYRLSGLQITEIISNGLETGKSKIMHWQIQHLVKASWFIGGHFLTLSHIIEGQWSSLLGLFYKGTTLSTKVYIVKTIVFPVVMLRCEIWTIKKAEH